MAEFPIVGIGSSAGGLEALQKLFGAMPPDSGLAFVIAAHLDPTQKSHLAELLGRCTKMPVVQIENSTKVEPDHVYVIAPDQELTIKNGVLRTGKPSAPRGHRHPVDSFFRSLAEDQGERAIAIVLSGTGTNGSLGLRFIKAEGGIAIAQVPESAGFAGMPQSAIATGIVDLVLPPEKMPESLLSIARHVYVREPAKEVEEPAPKEQLNTLLTLLRAQSKRDFTSYKKSAVLRRIHRRMGLHRIDRLGTYIERLRSDPGEIKALAADLTINVTGFFRDPEAWGELDDKVIAPLVQERSTGSLIRVWVPGCSTGEEAYSIAMLILDRAEAARKSFDLRLFATDVAEPMLTSARAGVYPASIEQDVEPERLERWFERQDDTYRVRKALRKAITFAPQNLLQDPPFSHMDLISCRNLLIYIEPTVQKRLLALFHFALRQGGHLFLGSAETASSQEDLFKPVSKKWRIYRRLGPTRHDVVNFPLVGAHDTAPGADTEAVPAPEPRAGPLMDQLLLDRYAPASALIDPGYRVLFLRGPTGEYLQPPSGEPSYNLLAMTRQGLKAALRMAVRRALEQGREVTIEARVRRGDGLHPVRVLVAPVQAGSNPAQRLLVSFFERDRAADEAARSEVEEGSSDAQLQAELDTTREDLRLTIEQMDTANEELKASNEEIRSVNEELKASNEELETSKEELQSLNEELNTVNQELQGKVRELEERTADLNNLLNSTDIATLFLDRSLCIRWFTPAMKALLDLIAADIGRPISHFAPKFRGGDLQADAKSVIADLAPAEAEVESDQSRWYLRRMIPYRTEDDRIDGVVVTFTDITARKRAEEALRASEERLRKLLEIDVLGVLFFDRSGTLVDANDVFLRMTGYSRREVEARKLNWRSMTPPEWVEASLEQLRKLDMTGRIGPYEKEFLRKDGSRSWMWFTGARLGDDTIVEYCVDIDDRKRAESALLERDERLRALVAGSVLTVWETSADGLVEADSPGWRALTGQTREEWSGFGWLDAVHPADRADAERRWREAVSARTLMDAEFRLRTRAGDWRWTNLRAVPLQLGDDGSVRKWLGMTIDISERKQTEEDKELLARELSHRVKNTLAVVQSLAIQTEHSDAVEQYRDKFIGRLQALARAHSMLLDANWRGADLKTLVEQAVAAYRADHPDVIEVEGEPVAITPRQGIGLSLVLHELGTNAAKYGALSRPEGGVQVSWWAEAVRHGRRLHLLWQEHDGPALEPPNQKGFGTRLIERACTHELEGEVELDYTPGGLRCELIVPLP
ncbi:MAG TPA: chemotaxis protein CheB [Geminicoccaceae bacterium]